MSCKECGSRAINEHLYGRKRGVDTDLCNVHYWIKRAAKPEVSGARLYAIPATHRIVPVELLDTILNTESVHDWRAAAAKLRAIIDKEPT